MVGVQRSRSDREKLRVAILTGASLAWNPRALKEAQSLAGADFEVTVYGASANRDQQRTDEELANERGFSFESVVPMDGEVWRSRLLSTWRRTRTRIGCDLNRYLRIERPWQLGTSVVELLKEAARARAHYYIAHLEQGAWAADRLRRAGFSVGIDMEDWYSEDLCPSARRVRPIRLLRNLEKQLLSTALHATCTSHAMSEALGREFECREPAVVYNAFPWADRKFIDRLSKDRTDADLPSIHWFSQTIGPDRGLDDLFAALPLLKHKAQVHLRGKPTKELDRCLKERLPDSWRGG